MTARLPCIVPFCRRSAPKDRWPGATEYLCPKHYPLASKTLRRRLQRIKRRYGPTATITHNRARALSYRLWERIKARAIEAAAGI